MAARFLIGVDLGTVNTALASVDLLAGGDPVEAIEAWPIPQLVAPGQVAPRRLLPSALYLPGPELPPEQRRLPWPQPEDARRGEPGAVGELAREQGARVPGRLVTSAKSWLANPRVDRRAPILPWGAPPGVRRLSPVEASARYLEHLRLAWNAAHPDGPLEAQEIVLAVPASFDEAARELTLQAAVAAGLAQVALIEEPTAAFHDWAGRNRADLAGALGLEGAPGGSALVLVVDVGGGTTDLTLVRAEIREGRPAFTRLAVGDHLLLGGDNMDLALARAVEARLPEKLDAARFGALLQACRAAKERLLAEDAPERVPVVVVGRGARLLQGAVSADLGREEARHIVLDGFFPAVSPGDRPQRTPRTAGLAELGLPYEPDPAVTRHVLAFLAAHAGEAGGPGSLARPDAILVNGGVFTPRRLRERVVSAVSALFPGAAPVRILSTPALDLAVARGAVASALVRRGIGLRMGGGTARAYFVGIATPTGERALCVVPRHLEEGTRVAVPRPFTLALGRPVRFPLLASARPRPEQPGDVVPIDGDLTPLPPLEAVLEASGELGRGAAEVPVRLEALLTEIGTLELWCVSDATAVRAVSESGSESASDSVSAGRASSAPPARWKLEFGIRASPLGGEQRAPRAAVGPSSPRMAEASEQVERYYGKRAAVDPKGVKGLFRALERILGPRDGWPTPVVRALWAGLHAGAGRRRRSADHERVWLQLTGFALRPGFGAPLDGWRAAETFAIFGDGLQYPSDPHAWQAWWVLWRRIAGGLDDAAQERVLDAVAPFVPPRDRRRPPPRVPGVRAEALDELIRLAGSLERLRPARKVALGHALLERIAVEGPSAHVLWALGRLGARVPFHGSAHQVVPAWEAEAWTRRLLELPAPPDLLAFPLAQLARRSGDRDRDLPDALRGEVAAALARGGSPPEAIRGVEEVAAPSEEEDRMIFGESLPPGLRLVPVPDPDPDPDRDSDRDRDPAPDRDLYR